MTKCTNFLTLIIFSTILLGLTSCESTEYKASANQKSEVITDLNTGDADKVINKLKNKNKDDDEIFYLASAYASKGGIDIYSMYPMLELRLFHESAINWGDINTNDNKYFKILSKRPDLDKKTPEDREQIWAESEHLLKRKFDIQDPIDCDKYGGLLERCQEMAELVDNRIAEAVEARTIDDFRYEFLYEDYDNLYEDIVGEQYSQEKYDQYILVMNQMNRMNNDFSFFIERQVEYEYEKDRFINGSEEGDVSGSDATLMMMNALWMTYEAIPLLKSLPEISLGDQDYVTLAIEELEKIRKKPKYKVKAHTFIYSLSLFSLLSIYSTSFDFDKVESPADLSCQFKPEALVENYSLLRKRFETILTHAEEAQIDEELKKELIQKRAEFDELPEDLTRDQKDEFIKRTRSDQREDCSVESLL